jgi:hypothetical protein
VIKKKQKSKRLEKLRLHTRFSPHNNNNNNSNVIYLVHFAFLSN